MARIESLNPDVAATLVALRQQMLNQQLARTALQATVQKHHAATLKAKAAHKRRPLVKLV